VFMSIFMIEKYLLYLFLSPPANFAQYVVLDKYHQKILIIFLDGVSSI
jgi:hypothetical protein